MTAVTAPSTITIYPTSPATAGNKYVFKVAADAVTHPAIGDTITDWTAVSTPATLTSGNHIVVAEITADNRVVKTSVEKTIS